METPLPSVSQPTLNSTHAAAVSSSIPAAVNTVTLPLPPINGSPRAAVFDTGGNPEPLAAVPGSKLRLMCSFGGHIMPRPHDKSLTYSGGETRLVVVDRRSSLASLRSRLSGTLLNGRSFTLKYQLPSEDLDSLVTITTDEDLENMIEEYDRMNSSATATATQRIRLFLFANKLETAATMGSLLGGAKSETWFVDALNQSGFLPRGLSDSAAVNNTLVNLDSSIDGESEIQNSENNDGGENNKQEDPVANGAISHQEMPMSSMSDSPMEPTGSSIGSSSSSPSTSNVPSIHVRVGEDQRIDEQFAPLTFSDVQTQRHFDDGANWMANRQMMIPSGAMTDAAMAYNDALNDGATAAAAAASNGQISPDDDRSYSGVSSGCRKPPLPMQHDAIAPRTSGGYGLASPDSVASDTSLSSATSFSKPMYYQEQPPALPRSPVTQPETTLVQTPHIPPQSEATSSQTTTSHVIPQPGNYTTVDQQHQPPTQQHQPPTQQNQLPTQQHQPPTQQPFLHHGVQYIPVYTHQQQNYPMYMVSIPQSQYVPAGTPPVYPNSKPATNSRPEAAQNVYHPLPPQVLQLPQQHQYMAYTGAPQHNTNPNYSTGVPQHNTNPNANYGTGVPQHITNANGNYSGAYEFINPSNETVYYHAQTPAANTGIPLASPYQTMTPAAAAAALADMSKQMALDGGKQQQHGATSQPL